MFAFALSFSLLLTPTPVQQKVAPKILPAKPVGAKPGTKADDPIVELLDELIAKMIDDIVGQTGIANAGDLKVERGDVYTGLESLKQTGQERHAGSLKGWVYKIVEKPTGPNEFRYVRFAWKKEKGDSILLGFANDNGWSGKRYAAGGYDLGATGHKVADKAPEEWTVVTRDVFKDFGAFGLTGILFSSAGGGTSLFDHVLLGRSIEDLDIATNAALGKAKSAGPLAGKIRDDAWADLLGDDRTKASVAFRTFLPVAGDQVEFIKANMPRKKTDTGKLARAGACVPKLKDENFDVRIAAETELVKLGESAIPILKAALEATDEPETQFRAKAILKKLGWSPSDLLPSEARAGRIVRLLERAMTKDAKALLEKLAAGEFGGDYPTEATAALARLNGK